MQTLTIQQQMQVIMEKVREPAIIEVPFEVIEDDDIVLKILAEAHADDEAQPWRTTANLDDYYERGGEERLLELIEDYL